MTRLPLHSLHVNHPSPLKCISGGAEKCAGDEVSRSDVSALVTLAYASSVVPERGGAYSPITHTAT